MFSWFIRVIITVLSIVIICVFTAMTLGQQFNNFPGLFFLYTDYRTDPIISEYVYIDHNNNLVLERASPEYFYTSSPDGATDFRYQIIDNHLDVYVKSARQATAHYLGTYPLVSNQVQILWSSDSKSLYVSNVTNDDLLDLIQVDIDNGEASSLGKHDFGYSPNLSMALTHKYLLIGAHLEKFFLFDVDKQQAIIYTGTNPRISFDRRYLAWQSTDFSHISEGSDDFPITRVHVLNLLTMEESSLNIERTDSLHGVNFMAGWSPVDSVLAISNDDDTVLLYNADEHTFWELPDEYRFAQMDASWSSDGTRLVLVAQRAADQQEYVILNIYSNKEILLGCQNVYNLRNLPEFEWSPDDRHILHYYSGLDHSFLYNICDGTTGELLYGVIERLGYEEWYFFQGWLSY